MIDLHVELPIEQLKLDDLTSEQREAYRKFYEKMLEEQDDRE